MKTVTLLACLAAVNAYIKLDQSKLEKRDSIEDDGDFKYNGFYVDAAFGTPAQKVKLTVDFSSSDVYTNHGKCARMNKNQNADKVFIGNNTCPFLSYNYSLSSTANSTFMSKANFQTELLDGSLLSDVMQIGDAKLEDFYFGLEYETGEYFPQGVLGLSTSKYYSGVTVLSDLNLQWDFFMDRLVQDKQITRATASVYFGDDHGDDGSVLLGAVDHAKYSGELQWFSTYDYPGVISVTGFGDQDSKFSGNLDVRIGPFINETWVNPYSAPQLADMILYYFGLDASLRYPYVDCLMKESPVEISFYTKEGNLTCPLLQLISRDELSEECRLEVVVDTFSSDVQLGYNFLKHMYIVGDGLNSSDSKIGFAPKVVSDESDIDESGDWGSPHVKYSKDFFDSFETLDNDYLLTYNFKSLDNVLETGTLEDSFTASGSTKSGSKTSHDSTQTTAADTSANSSTQAGQAGQTSTHENGGSATSTGGTSSSSSSGIGSDSHAVHWLGMLAGALMIFV
ncbi:CIC11C00000000478 [Sungouiella intermedia]|uniref:CIC11C00000000478 n=1 Tax=Sungouiella intermedia TaxID=45354 RepID=A0A1L0BGR9_9ASCO|nr:CIC11C00000000478 [[Candida] intermedia]